MLRTAGVKGVAQREGASELGVQGEGHQWGVLW